MLHETDWDQFMLDQEILEIESTVLQSKKEQFLKLQEKKGRTN